MEAHFNLDNFISTYVTKRDRSLLADDFIKYNTELTHWITGKKVLVIGGAGTIGSSYISAILKFKIRKLVVVDTNKNSLSGLVDEIRSSMNYDIPLELITYPVNFGDSIFEKIFRHHGPFEIVANFAALKHVRSEKDIFSIEAMMENNVLRARKLLNLLLEFPPEHFFCVSTDKAANPVNIMGASKKLMEELIMAYSDKLPIVTARFANVAFSNGSLLSGFLERINKKQPLAGPMDVRRFFLSPQESGELCLMASIMGTSGDIFFPKLDEEKDMITFDQIAKDLLISLDLEPEVCQTEEEAKQKALLLTDDSKAYPIYFVGTDTSGEKAFEEFYTENEDLDLDSFINLGVIKNSRKRDIKEIDEIIDRLRQSFDSKDVTKEAVVNILKEYLPNFAHIETGKNLDQKM